MATHAGKRRRGGPLRRADASPPVRQAARPLIVTVCGQKGGTGKTTGTLGLAAMAAAAGIRTLVYDADRIQGSALTATHALDQPGYECTADPAKFDIRTFGLVLIDTPGSLEGDGTLTEVLKWSDLALIPSDFTALSAGPTLRTAGYVAKHGCSPRVVLNGIDPRFTSVEKQARAELGEAKAECLTASIRRSTAHANALRDGVPISRYDRGGEYAGRARRDLMAVLVELLRLRPDIPLAMSEAELPQAVQ